MLYTKYGDLNPEVHIVGDKSATIFGVRARHGPVVAPHRIGCIERVNSSGSSWERKVLAATAFFLSSGLGLYGDQIHLRQELLATERPRQR